ncbi:type V CRISPR-associated protein Cas4 [Butyrivibrio sp. NC3005]|uniref:type V CRISPR-associated protein Cas4 n=1 Tax=Butyrivibrio sp. NC3005 TaxID=1280685 RepID=UPI0004074D95|nr:type V CRISPR-associated protein Cas4 [Butyrivibrio sp. NC3005]
MEDAILITELNDFIFCPVSIYFHKMYKEMDRMIYQNTDQINGTAAHKTVDDGTYSSSKDILTGLDVYCEKYIRD